MSATSTRAAVVHAWPRPAPALVALLAAWGALGAVAALGDLSRTHWLLAGALLALAAGLDAWRLRRAPDPHAERRVVDTWPIGTERPVTLTLALAHGQQALDVFDLHPVGWTMRGLPRRIRLRGGEATQLDYTLRAPQRGDFRFDGVQLRLHSPWRLWRQSRVLGPPQTVRVFPNFAPLAKFAMFSAEQASRLVGAHLKRRRGEGTDFHQMREYRIGDSLRQIDWKATARARRLISREYQDERNQQLVLLLDTGRRMMARDGEQAHFDHALDAALVVAYLALRQGDAVGLLASGGDGTWVPPRRGREAIDPLLRATYALQPQPVATDLLAAATELSLRQRRRALVMLVTSLRDEDIDDLLTAVQMLRRRHLVCVASLREQALDDVLVSSVTDLDSAIRAGAAADYLQRRRKVHEALGHHGVMVLDVTCAQLAGALVDRYLAVKRDGLL
ncbi:MAG TPA: DUF58 domain-containing protein [Lysobacter sp.]|nr:DUF58 domain-containing protein [Lysobacter sp.]